MQLKLVGAAVVVIFLILQIYFPTKTYLSKKQEESKINNKLEYKKLENNKIKKQIEYYKTEKGIKELAKNDLQMVKENEDLYIPIVVEKPNSSDSASKSDSTGK